MTQINGYKGFVGYSIRELNSNELSAYCIFKISPNSFPLPSQNQTNFTSDFMLRVYSSGCYYYDTGTGKWSSYGMDIYEDTNLEHTHCLSNHLTAFAGGLALLPSAINFQYAFSNASPTRNAYIYAALLLVTACYAIISLWAKFQDWRDAKKLNTIFLGDNHPRHGYFYELIVFTGNRNDSGTRSVVRFKLSGDLSDTGVRVLNEDNTLVLKRSSVDSFIMAVSR